jgi:predicted ATPase
MTVPAPNRTVTLRNWVVLTGVPCCGKSTLAGALSGAGQVVCPEAARTVVDGEIERDGLTSRQVRENALAFSLRVLEFAIQQEQALPSTGTVVLDRAVPDCLAYLDLFGGCAPARVPDLRGRYQQVFVLDRLPFVGDGLRDQRDSAIADKLEPRLYRIYHDLGCAVVRVPVMPIAARTAFVLHRMRECRIR